MQKKTIAAVAALLVILALLVAGAKNTRVKGPSGDANNLSGLLGGLSLTPSTALPSLGDAFTVTAAWSVFQDYLKAAEARDIDKVKSLSYQISETCSNPAKKAECEELMGSVAAIASGFKAEDFRHVFYDDRQIIMTTDYMKMGEGADDTKVVLYFAKAESGEPKVLGIRFCYGTEDANHSCVITDPQKRDSDKDGWWDDVEAFFYKK